ncbi:hypothetical protein [Streptomyces sp. PSAA01]|nr:hypothetical protein [Streptomyces sp. PSAA01]MCG0290968.1 hypothetical protein [Streptomyces sp. PSAA01]
MIAGMQEVWPFRAVQMLRLGVLLVVLVVGVLAARMYVIALTYSGGR